MNDNHEKTPSHERHALDSSQNAIWIQVLDNIKKIVSDSQFSTWIEPLTWEPTLLEDTSEDPFRVLLRAPNAFMADWIADHHQEVLSNVFEQILKRPVSIEIGVQSNESKPAPTSTPLRLDLESPLRPQKPKKMVSETKPKPSPTTTAPWSPKISTAEATRAAHANIDPQYVFESFVVGSSNQFAHATAYAVAERPAVQYNPLFLHSSPGLGKTHLLHAIGNHVMKKNPNAKVAYLSAEQFVNELVESIQHKRMSEFREKYRKSFDLLLIDDIQFIAGRQSTEEEFFHTFNELYRLKRQIVLTSDRPPKEIERLEERIRTRFEWGLVSDIQPPEVETRIAILRAKAERDDIFLPEDVATFLATHIKSNVRELEGVLIKLKAQASLTGSEITLEMAKHELRSVMPEQSSMMTVEEIQNRVARTFKIKVSDLKSASRQKSFALPRQIAMFLTRKYTDLTVKEIGLQFGGKDHTTVLHAASKIESAILSDPAIAEAVENIQNQL